MYILIKLTKKWVFLLSREQQVIMWNIRKYRNAAWETQVGVRWNLRQVCQVRWAYQIIPSNRFWITRCDWVTTINKVTWVQANWKHKHTHTHTHKNTEWMVEMLSTNSNNDNAKWVMAHIQTNKNHNVIYFYWNNCFSFFSSNVNSEVCTKTIKLNTNRHKHSKCLTTKCSSKLGWNKTYFAAEIWHICQFLSSCGMAVTTLTKKMAFCWHQWLKWSKSQFRLLLEILNHCSWTQPNTSTLVNK